MGSLRDHDQCGRGRYELNVWRIPADSLDAKGRSFSDFTRSQETFVGQADVAVCRRKVYYRVKSGKHLLAASISRFDPLRSFVE